MLNPLNAIDGITAFLETGGPILVWILGLTFALWMLIVERLLYWNTAHGQLERQAITQWDQWRRDHPGWREDPWKKWDGEAVRNKIISEVKQRAQANVDLVKILVGIAPLLGLLGTVTGMVAVFDVMAISGSSNIRGMSAGVSRATIPTMAGMVVSLSGLYFSYQFERDARSKIQKLADKMVLT